jgi:hypothetical protein
MVVIFILFAIVAIAAGIYGSIQAKKRREGLFVLAQRLNLQFNPQSDYALPDRFSFFKEFDNGSNRYATNILSGTYREHNVLAFDYHYETHSTDSHGNRQTEHHWFSFVTLNMPAAFPGLNIRREGLFTKIAEVFGYQAIKFESAEFSKNFCVRSDDKKFAYDVCNAKMIEYLLANQDLSIEIENQVLALVFNTRLSVEQFDLDLDRLMQVRTRLPDYLFASQ